MKLAEFLEMNKTNDIIVFSESENIFLDKTIDVDNFLDRRVLRFKAVDNCLMIKVSEKDSRQYSKKYIDAHNKIVKAYKCGDTGMDIHKKTGVDYTTVLQHMKDMGVLPKRSRSMKK